MVQAERGRRETFRSGARSRKLSYSSERVEETPCLFSTPFSPFSHAPAPRQFCSEGSKGRERSATGNYRNQNSEGRRHSSAFSEAAGTKGQIKHRCFHVLSLSPDATWPWRQNSHRSGWFLTGRMKRSYRKLESTRRGMMLRNATP